MALLWLDGFEGYGDVDTVVSPSDVLARRYGQTVYPNQCYVRAGRFGGKAIQGASESYSLKLYTPPLTTQKTLVTGFALYNSQMSVTATKVFVGLYEDATLGVNLRTNPYGQLLIYQGDTLLGTTPAGVFGAEVWHCVELKVHCDSTAGTVELRLNGDSVLSLTGVNTQAGTNGFHNIVSLNGASRGYLPMYDDFYVCDGSGSANNDFLGPVRILPIFPNGVGDATEWTASAAGDHFNYVDESPVNDDTDYVEDAVTGHKELWAYSDIPQVQSVKGVAVHTDAKVTDANQFALKTLAKTNGSEHEDTGQTVSSDSYMTKCRVMETNPITGLAWTQDDINNLQLGVKVG